MPIRIKMHFKQKIKAHPMKMKQLVFISLFLCGNALASGDSVGSIDSPLAMNNTSSEQRDAFGTPSDSDTDNNIDVGDAASDDAGY